MHATSETSRPATRRLVLARRIALGALAVLVVAAVWTIWPYWQLAGALETRHELQPSRLYGRAFKLDVGGRTNPTALVSELEALGYRPWAGSGDLGVGRYRRQESVVGVRLRTRPTPGGWAGPAALEVRFDGRRVAAIRLAGEDVEHAELDPPLVASYAGDEQEERVPVRLAELPEEVVQAVLAVEDDGFWSHQGLSISGIVRAAWINLRGGEVRQGGSTLTQQLVKNLFLTHERTVSRKAREALLAVMVEARHDKATVLEAYLNEIYLGRRAGSNLLGVGAAARGYFGKSAAELDLAEAALLAGMIKAPALYDPIAHPERSRERRDQVLDRLEALRWVPGERIAEARNTPVSVGTLAQPSRQVMSFAELAAAEAASRFDVGELAGRGYVLLSTLDRDDQKAAEAALVAGLAELEEGWQKGRGGVLQAALVSLDPRSGGVLAYLGGRDYAKSQFDRASKAKRQAGSAFKPVVFAAALEARAASPSTLVDDSPLTIDLAGRAWSPKNDDETFAGWISARAALEQSRNVPTVRLALQVGLPQIVEMARAMGVSAPLDPVPALALGAFEVTPLELTTVYGTLANQGSRPAVHSLRGLLDPRGAPVGGRPLPAPARVLSPQSSYLLTSMLQGVFERGTARSAREEGVAERLAGKTGTTNGRRDSWFAGYSADRATVVWVGYDDNAATRLSGARAALPIWVRFVQEVRPAGGFLMPRQPAGIVSATIDPESGELASELCPTAQEEVFIAGEEPVQPCHLHAPWAPQVDDPRGPGRERHPFKRWLDRLFRDRKQGGPP